MVAQHIFKTAGVAALILALYLHLKNLGIMKKKNHSNNKNNKLWQIGRKLRKQKIQCFVQII